MNRITVIIMIDLLAGCSKSISKSEIIGVWVSNKKLTIKDIKEKDNGLTKKNIIALEKILGEMAYIFEKNRATFTPDGSVNLQNQWHSWEIIESTDELVVVEIYGLENPPKKVSFFKRYGCLGLAAENQPYVEFFCKQSC